MDKLVLVKEGVFPITKDKDGNQLHELPRTGFNISGTIQGEGKLAGTSALFIRLASCNLRCIWTMPDKSLCHCDTSYASFEPDTATGFSIEEIIRIVRHNIGEMKHIVITGGEPFLQKKPLALLCKSIKKEFNAHITIETNGTLFDNEIAQWVDLFSISPKLSNSTPNIDKLEKLNYRESGPFKYHHSTRRNLDALQQFINTCSSFPGKDFQLKFVVASKTDAIEIKDDYLNHLIGWEKQDILIMPLGAMQEQLALTTPLAIELSISNGWRFCPRIHIDNFGSQQGV